MKSKKELRDLEKQKEKSSAKVGQFLLNLQNRFQKFILVVINFIPVLMKNVYRVSYLQRMEEIFGMLLLILF